MTTFSLAYGYGLHFSMSATLADGADFFGPANTTLNLSYDNGHTAIFRLSPFISAGSLYLTNLAVNYSISGNQIYIEDLIYFSNNFSAVVIDNINLFGNVNALFSPVVWAQVNTLNDVFLGAELSDRIYAGPGQDIVRGYGGNDVIDGDAGNDLLFGGIGNDLLIGDTGLDRLSGEAGFDVLYGLSGNDTLDGGSEADRLLGGTENDWLIGGTGNDTLLGESGNDILHGGLDNDVLYGGDGVDWALGEAGIDILYGQAGNDRLDGGTENDFLYGGTENDVLSGGAGNDVLSGDFGNDTLFGGPGNDRLIGGPGLDRYVFRPGDGADVISGFFARGERIDLTGFHIRYSDLHISSAEAGSSTIVRYGTLQIYLDNVAPASISSADFLL